MKTLVMITAATLLLGACASQAPQTLDQKLSEATNASDRKETLRLACLNEAEWPVRSKPNKFHGRHASQRRLDQLQRNPEVREMKSLCRQMDDLTTADAEDKLPPKELASACASKVAEKKQKDGKGWIDHAARIQHICTEMTGSKAVK